MAIKPSSVTKKGAKYAVVKAEKGGLYYSYEYWYVVDVETGTAVSTCYSAGSAKWELECLEDGTYTLQHFSGSSIFGEPVDLPPSLQKMQDNILHPKAPKAKSSKPIGSTSTTILHAYDEGAFTVFEMEDGTFGFYVPSTGASKFGYKRRSGATNGGKKVAAQYAENQLYAMGMDPGADAVETLSGVYEGRMRDAFQQAADEMAERQAKYLEEFEKKRKQMMARLQSGQITQEDYDSWLRGETLHAKWYDDMVEGLSNDLVSADRKAMDMVNGYVPKAYAENVNYATFQIEGSAKIDTGFSIYNESTVARLVSNPEGSLLPELPQAQIDALKDKVWAKQKISSCTLQSILQGESVDMAAKRLRMVVGMSANSAMRAARTSLTAAQNLGRLDAGRRAKELGIDLKKQWIATVDSRTRYSHREMDRETVELEQDFSNGCDCPGHLNGGSDAGEVYNCRCAMRYVMPGHEYDDLPDKTREGVDYEEWKNERLTKLAAQKDKIQQQLDQNLAAQNDLKALLPENKTYSGIWKSDVTLDDYELKKGSISAKEDYYLQQILNAPNTQAGNVQVMVAKKNLEKLNEFQTLGEQYKAAKDTVETQLGVLKAKEEDLRKRLRAAGGRNAYSEERKAAARRWHRSKDADDALRHYTSQVWLDSTRTQRDAVWGYTSGSGRYNRPLSGFQGGWGSHNFRGVGNVDLDYEGGASAIRAMTEIVGKSEFAEDVWLRRGCNYDAMESFFGLDFGTLSRMTDDELQGFVGHSNRIAGFVSCGTASEGGTGFGGAVDMRIFVPAGTNAIYAEPFSAYGYGGGRNWDGISSQSSFGSEFETIIQRGTSFDCTKVERRNGRLYVELEAHPEDGYDLFGQEG